MIYSRRGQRAHLHLAASLVALLLPVTAASARDEAADVACMPLSPLLLSCIVTADCRSRFILLPIAPGLQASSGMRGIRCCQ